MSRSGKFFLLFFSCIFSGSVFAQFTSFSPDPAIFIKEFEEFNKGASHGELDANFAVFKENWNLGKFSPVQQKTIIKLSNDMLMEKMPAHPYFTYMLSSLTAFNEQKLPDKVLIQWQNVTQQLLGTDNRNYLEFLKITSTLFRDKILYKDASKTWTADTNDFDIVYSNGQIAIRYPGVTLTCKGVADKIVIQKTSGIYYPAKTEWQGAYGQMNFDRVLPGENVIVEFKKFKVDFSNTNIPIDTATLSYNKYFASKIQGRFEDKLSSSTDTASVKKMGYPKFASFANSLEIKGIVGPYATFKGGFSMIGAEINTKTANGQESEINIYFKDKKKVMLRSKFFRIENGAATSNEAYFVVFHDSGNLYHPKANANFNFKDDKLVITRNNEGLQRVPFTDEYHMVDLDMQQIRWEVTKPHMDFDNINNEQEAKISSAEFFKELIYARQQAALNFNPLEAIMAFHAKFLRPRKTTKFALREYADFIGTQREHLVNNFIELHDQGFIQYLPEQDSAIINIKLFRYVQAHQKTRDYDVIRFSSLIAARPNATLNLLSNELNVEGVSKFIFSDSQNVIVVPTEQKISIRKNRTVAFGGQIRAGRFDFFGKKFEFDYNNFQIVNPNIDSMRMYFPDSTGRSLVAIKNVLRNINGTLYVDKPNNKSGIQNFAEYPIFKSDRGSEILYDKPNIHGGAYKSDRFKFEVDPFTIDSLDNFTLSGLQLEGTFISDGIFPDFRHKASIQKDYSLGFIVNTPPGGYPMYRGKGRGEMKISLSEEGLYGLNGDIGYNGSKTEFTKMLLLPQKAVGQANSYSLAQDAKYPQVYAELPSIEWNPYEDKMVVAQGEKPIKVFKSNYDFYGKIIQTPSSLKGDGTLSWEDARFTSNDMKFGPNKASADKASLKIYAADSTKIAFETHDIKGNMDFDKRLGTFTTNQPNAETRFPFNSFVTNMNDYKWDMTAKTIEAKPSPTLGATPYFLSTNLTQDSLKFEAKKGIYSLIDYTLKVEQIPYIDIADSRLYLADGKLTIRENGDIDIVDSARFIADRVNKFHDITKLRIKIYGKNKVRGSGTYFYTNGKGLKQEFKLDSVIVNADKHLEGVGKIDESLNFTLDTKIGYKGFAQVLSNEKNIRFKGYVIPLHTFKNIIPPNWIRFDDRVDPKAVVINVQDPRDKDNKKQYVGLFIANDSSHVYPSFFSWKRRYSDPDVSNDTGVFYYDHESQSFFAGNREKLLEGGLKGSFLQLNEKDHSIHAEGPLDFGLESANIKFKNAGTADLKAGDSSFTFQLAMMLDFPLPKEYVDRIKEMITADGTGSVDLNNDFFKNALGEMITDDKTATQIIKNLEKTGRIQGKDEAEYKLILSDATFRWDSKLQGMYCNDDVEVASFAGMAVNKNMKMTMLLEHKRAGENIYLYWQIGDSWIYINLSKNFASLASNDTKLNEIFVANYTKINTDTYFLKQATSRQVERFLAKLGE